MSSNVAVTDGVMAADQSPKWMRWTGRVLTALPVALLVLSAALKLSQQPKALESLVHKLGYAESSLQVIGAVELLSAVLYAFPRTALLGAILVTGYLGGAVASHVRIGEPFVTPIVLGIVVWVALYLREPQVRALFPLFPKRS